MAAAVAVGVTVAAGVVMANRGSVGVTSNSPAAPPPPALLGGRLPVDFYGARLLIPAGWEIMRFEPGADCPYQDDRSVLLGSTEFVGCAPSKHPTLTPTSAIRMTLAVGVTQTGGTPVTVNGINGFIAAAADGSRTYSFSDVGLHFTSRLIHQSWTLGVRIMIRSPEADDIIKTLAPSVRRTVLNPVSPPTAPNEWKTVKFDHIRFKAPRSWPVRTLSATGKAGPPGCGRVRYFPRPAVMLGGGNPAVTCDHLLDGPYASDGVWAHSPPNDQGSPSGAGTSDVEQVEDAPTTINGVAVTVLQPGVDGAVTVNVGGTTPPLRLTIGLGSDPLIARTILYSLQHG